MNSISQDLLSRQSLLTKRDVPAEPADALPKCLVQEFDSVELCVGEPSVVNDYLDSMSRYDQLKQDLDTRPGHVELDGSGYYGLNGGWSHAKAKLSFNEDKQAQLAEVQLRKSADDKRPHQEISLDASEPKTRKLVTSLNEPGLSGKGTYVSTSSKTVEKLKATARQDGNYVKYEREYKDNVNVRGLRSESLKIEYPAKSVNTFNSVEESEMISEAIRSAAETSSETLLVHDGTPLDGDKRKREGLIISDGSIPVGELGVSEGVVEASRGKVDLTFETELGNSRKIVRQPKSASRDIQGVSLEDRVNGSRNNGLSFSRSLSAYQTMNGKSVFEAEASISPSD